MTDLSKLIERARRITTALDRAIAGVPQFARGKVWCKTCGREERVDSAFCLSYGWPKCCGYTMTIDSPEERAARSPTAEKGE